ncbi:MAG: hypothetical protein LC624_07170, partial [Halobacteriales archaeon]|nr:hypothetical protein [Halobacteriales archaeon]
TGGGIPSSQVTGLSMGAGAHTLFVAHGIHNGPQVRVWWDQDSGTDAPILEVSLTSDPNATQFALEISGGNSVCHGITEVEAGVPNGGGGTFEYDWTCDGGTCSMSRTNGLSLCVSSAPLVARWQGATIDGSYQFRWNPANAGSNAYMKVILRADAATGHRHTVTFNFLKNLITIDETGLLLGNSGPFTFANQQYLVTIIHRVDITEVPSISVSVDGQNVVSTNYALGETASAFALEATGSNCQKIATLVAPS